MIVVAMDPTDVAVDPLARRLAHGRLPVRRVIALFTLLDAERAPQGPAWLPSSTARTASAESAIFGRKPTAGLAAIRSA
jgi:hypothetical protein